MGASEHAVSDIKDYKRRGYTRLAESSMNLTCAMILQIHQTIPKPVQQLDATLGINLGFPIGKHQFSENDEIVLLMFWKRRVRVKMLSQT